MTENTANSSIFTHFSTIKDPRVNRCKKHKLIDILFMTLSAVICGADNWVAIEAFCKAKKAWLTDVLKLKNGIPSHDTFGNVFAMLDTEQFSESVTIQQNKFRFYLTGFWGKFLKNTVCTIY